MPARVRALTILCSLMAAACADDGGSVRSCVEQRVLSQPLLIHDEMGLAMLADYTHATAPIEFRGLLLQQVGGIGCLQQSTDIIVHENPNLAAFTGFSGLQTLDGQLRFGGNPQLRTLAGFGVLSVMSGNLSIDGSPDLEDLEFPQLSVVGGLSIRDLDGLATLDGLSSLNEVRGGLVLDRNEGLASLSAFGGLSRVGGQFEIRNNPALGQITGLTALAELGGLAVMSNAGLTAIRDLKALETVGTIDLQGNPQLGDLTGLSGLQVADTLRIHDAEQLTDLQGLNALQRVETQLRIVNNVGLTSLSGLDSLVYADTVIIIDNPNLPTCEVSELVDRLENTPKEVMMTGNLADTCSP